MKEKLKEFFEKLKVIPLIALSSILWKTGGSGKKEFRRIYLPIILAGISLYETQIWWAFFITGMFGGTFALGYGIPDSPDLSFGDEGSSIARFWLRFTDDLKAVRFLTRLTCGIAYSGICLAFVIIGIKSPWDMVALAVGIPLICSMELGKIEEILIGGWIGFWFLNGLYV